MIRAGLVLALFIAGCSNEGEPGSCYRNPDNACVEYGKAMGGAGKRLCSAFTWRAGEKSCPTENRLGMCAKEKGAVTEIVYSGAPNNYDISTARNACEFKGGVFLPGSTGAAPAPKQSPSSSAEVHSAVVPPPPVPPTLESAQKAALDGRPADVKKILEPRVMSGRATPEEAKLLRASCKQMGDTACVDAVKQKYP
jgi:hypothetical protein